MIIALLIVIGLIFGSFVNALVWRVHEQSKTKNKKQKAKSKQDLSILRGRSMCVHCHHVLTGRDLIPVFSWLGLRGKCRYCHKKIDDNPLVEIGTAGLFAISYLYWPSSLQTPDFKLQFAFWLVFLVGFIALAAYDLRWMLLPNRIVYPLIYISMTYILLFSVWQHDVTILTSAVAGLLIVGGLFYVLFQFSKGRWIGGGDVKLGALLGIIVGGPANALLLLFLASLSGCLVAVPLMLLGKANRRSRLPFGPFLLLAAVIVFLFGGQIITWYQNLLIIS